MILLTKTKVIDSLFNIYSYTDQKNIDIAQNNLNEYREQNPRNEQVEEIALLLKMQENEAMIPREPPLELIAANI